MTTLLTRLYADEKTQMARASVCTVRGSRVT